MVADPRSQTKTWLDTYWTLQPSTTACIYAYPNYPLSYEFNSMNILLLVGTPESEALPVGIGYIENVPITIMTIDKSGVVGTKLRWDAENELRSIAEAHPLGSLRTLTRLSDNEQRINGTTFYSVTYILRYKRYN